MADAISDTSFTIKNTPAPKINANAMALNTGVESFVYFLGV